MSLPCLRDNERTSDSILIIVHVEYNLVEASRNFFHGPMVVLFTGFHGMNIYIYYIFDPNQAEKEDEERKRITFQSITFLAPLLAEMILFSWLSIKDIILLDRRSGSLVFLFFFFSYFCNICLLVSAD